MEEGKLSKKSQAQDIIRSTWAPDDAIIAAMEARVRAGGGKDKGLGPPDINDLLEVQLDMARRGKVDKIAIDSNILSYFVDVILPNYDPLNDHELLRKEKISILKIALYAKDVRLYILPLVDTEWKKFQIAKDIFFTLLVS